MAEINDLWICNPSANKQCVKASCGDLCYCTTRRDLSVGIRVVDIVRDYYEAAIRPKVEELKQDVIMNDRDYANGVYDVLEIIENALKEKKDEDIA